MRRSVAVVPLSALALAALAACEPVAPIEAVGVQRQFTLAENYQAAFARTNTQVRRCINSDLARVDGQVYSELGYAEVQATVQAFQTLPLSSIRFDDAGASTQVSLRIGPRIGPKALEWLEYWVRGGTRCPRISLDGETPPPL